MRLCPDVIRIFAGSTGRKASACVPRDWPDRASGHEGHDALIAQPPTSRSGCGTPYSHSKSKAKSLSTSTVKSSMVPIGTQKWRSCISIDKYR